MKLISLHGNIHVDILCGVCIQLNHMVYTILKVHPNSSTAKKITMYMALCSASTGPRSHHMYSQKFKKFSWGSMPPDPPKVQCGPPLLIHFRITSANVIMFT